MLLSRPNNLRTVRKAYRKQALKTHPDKLPPGLGEEEKAAFAEKFKEVCVSNNVCRRGDSSPML